MNLTRDVAGVLVVLVLSNKLLMQLFPHTILKALSQFLCGAGRRK